MQKKFSTWAGPLTIAAALLVCAGSPAAQSFTPPRTPWGDPDLQGNYTNKYEQGTPIERPAEFAGRRLEDIPDDERAALVRDRAEQVLLNSPFSGGDPQAGNLGGAPVFYDRFEADKGSRLWFLVDPPDGQIPPMSPEGARASAARLSQSPQRFGPGSADSHEDGSLYDRCITRGLPGSMMPTNYGNSYRIVQGPGYVAISYEMVHETRIVPLESTPRLGDAIRQYMGAARGHWEGGTLVVETMNLRDAYRGANPERVRYIERFTPLAADTLEWSFTIDDPSTWTKPWTFSMPLTRNDDEAILEYACHEGNRALTNLLTGARADDTAAVDAPVVLSADEVLEARRVAAARSASRLAGGWALESADGGNGGRRAFAGFSVASQLVIDVTDTEIRVDTDTGTQNQIRTAIYDRHGAESPVPGPLGWRTVARASLDGDDRLVVAITRSIQEPDGTPVVFEIEDVYKLAGDELTLERTQGDRTQTMVYRRY